MVARSSPHDRATFFYARPVESAHNNCVTKHDKLQKVLALAADSAHDGEALAALRAARELLTRDGLSFGDLARAVFYLEEALDETAFRAVLADQRVTNERRRHEEAVLEIQQLQSLWLQAQQQAGDARRQAVYWQSAHEQSEKNLARTRAELEHWRSLARDMAEQLWQVGAEIVQKNKA